MKTLHRANSRGRFSNSWLSSFHTFSFGDYVEPSRMSFGALRVLNDDTVAPEGGFDTHPHANMEIVSIPLAGSLSHRDSVGNSSVIQTGEVQLMSAGTGITHSEFNPSSTSPVNFLQIWVLPKEKNITPRYAQASYQNRLRKNHFVPIVVPIAEAVAASDSNPPEKTKTSTREEQFDGAIAINQDAYFSICAFDPTAQAEHTPNTSHNVSYVSWRGKHGNNETAPVASGVYFFLIDGSASFTWSTANGKGTEKIEKRDALGLKFDSAAEATVTIQGSKGALLLAIEVPI